MSESDKRELRTGNFEPVAIVGMAGMFPDAPDLDSFWSLIKNGRDAIAEVPASHWQPEDYFDANPKTPDRTYGRRGGFLKPYAFDPLKYGIPPASLEATDATQLLGMVVAEAAMEDAGYGLSRDFDRDRVSVILGITGALELVIPLGARLGHPLWRKALLEAGLDAEFVDELVRRIGEQYVGWQENSFPGLLGNVVAGRISKYLNTGGTNCVVDAACASSLSALEMAVMELATGRADLAITGGADTFNDIFMYMCFSKTPALSPTGDAKPFDRNGDGTILGEGIGFAVLKRLSDAERDGDRIYAVIKGVGSSSDGKGEAIYAPSSPGQMKALRAAYAQAEVTPDTIDLVEAHGTGTAKGDAVEARALREVYGAAGKRGAWCALGSIKSQIGHTKAAAGAAGLLKAAMALHHKVLPPTLKVTAPLDEVAPGASPFYVNTEKRPWLPSEDHPRRAAVSSFGFGGSNFHLVVEEYQSSKPAPDWDGEVQILAYEAERPSDFEAVLKRLDSLADWPAIRDEGARSREAFRPSGAHRLLFVCERGKSDLKKQIASARTLLAGGADFATSPDGVYAGRGEAAGGIAVLFPGQGAQYVGMQRDLVCQFPEALDVLAAAKSALGGEIDPTEFIYPQSAFDDAARKAQEEALRATDVAQPSLGAVSLGAWRVLQRFGVEAGAFAGHSYGELTALAAAERLTEAELFRFSRRRGELMAAGEGDRGSMLAVKAPLETIDEFLRESGLGLVLANRNAPDQGVLSGATESIDEAHTLLKERKITCTKLPVAAAFHSESVSAAARPFAEALADAELPSSTAAVYANTTGEPYPADAGEARNLLANQLARPVEFVREIQNMHDAGIRTFVECGPGARLTGLVKSIVSGRPHAVVALDTSNGKQSGITDLGRALAQLAALGHEVNLKAWDESHRPKPASTAKPRLLVDITGANYRSESSKPKKREPIARAAQTNAPAAQASERTAPTPMAATTVPAPSPAPASRNASTPPNTGTGVLHELLRQTQENIQALQRMQDQTAQLHRQYLEGQERAAEAFHSLLGQQQALFTQAVSDAPAPVPAQSEVAPQASAPVSAPVEEPRAEVRTEPTSEPAPAPAATGGLESALLEVVADKTGYPVEMLDAGMSLDADLGIDSIKRVEILSALQERFPSLPSLAADELGGIQTLGDIVARFGDTVPATASTPVESAAPGRDWTALLLSVVSEKTGYPVEMLELSMSLDADLGIDSIKRVEILAALQELAPELPSVEADILGTLQTLDDVAAHLLRTAPTTAPASTSAPAANAEAPLTAASGDLMRELLEIVAEKTGYPAEMLEPGMNLEGDLGIDSIKRVEILSALQEQHPELPTLEADALGALQTLDDIARALGGSVTSATASAPKPAAPAKPAPPVSQTEAPGPIAGSKRLKRQVLRTEPVPPASTRAALSLRPDADIRVTDDGGILASAVVARLQELGYNATLVSLESREQYPDGLDALIVIAPVTGAGLAFLKEALFKVQSAGAALRRAGERSAVLLATVSRLDGAFGLKHLDAAMSPLAGGLAGLAKTAAHEWPEVTCRAVDLAQDFDSVQLAAQRCVEELLAAGPVEVGTGPDGTVTPTLADAPLEDGKLKAFTKHDVVLLTGGARGVTAATAKAIAKHTKARLVLFGRSPKPEREPEWLETLRDEAAIKRGLMEHAAQPLSPRALESEYAHILAAREIRDTLSELETLGARVRYVPVDIRDATAVKKAIDTVRDKWSEITAIVHGAGVLADRRIEDKTPEQVDAVLGTKVEGLNHVLDALNGGALHTLVLFSSSTGRFGRTGQVDYSIANEALNKIAHFEAGRRGDFRAVSINWGPWAGGMVTPALAQLFAAEGVGLIGLEAGAELVLRELVSGGKTDREVVVHGEIETAPARTETLPANAMTVDVSVERFPSLRSHVIDGKAVVPVALELEWFAHAALHEHPGYKLHAIEGFRVFKGVILESLETRRLAVLTGPPQREREGVTVPVELRSADGTVRHAAARVSLVTRLPQDASPRLNDPWTGGYPKSLQEIYEEGLLFHGDAFQGIADIEGADESGIAVLARTAPLPKHWCTEPMRGKWCADPLAIDCAFQALILWSFQVAGHGSLPVAFERYEQFTPSFPKGAVRIAARIDKRSDHHALANIEFTDAETGALVARITGYECVIDASLRDAFRRSELASGSVQG